jgi:hypothetical protein
MLLHRPSIVDSRKFTIFLEKQLWSGQIQLSRFRVDGEAIEECGDFVGLGCVPFGIRPPENNILVTDWQVKEDLAILLESVECVAWESIRSSKPLFTQCQVKSIPPGREKPYFCLITLCLAPRKHADVEGNVRIPLPVLASILHSVDVAGLRYDGKYNLRY